MNLYAYVDGDPINAIDPLGLIIKQLIQKRLTGKTRIHTRLDSRHPLDPLVDSLPVNSYSLYLEHKYEQEEWASFEVLVDVETDECGNFIRREELSAKQLEDTEYWVTLHEWERYRTIMMGVPLPVEPFPKSWEKWRQLY